MLSKNNNRELRRKMEDKKDRFSIRKLSIGVASVLLGSFLMGIQVSQTVYASDSNIPTTSATSDNLQRNSGAEDTQQEGGNVPSDPSVSTETPSTSLTNEGQTIVRTHQIMEITSETDPKTIPDTVNIKPSDLIKHAYLNVNYQNSDNSNFTGRRPQNAKQEMTFKGKAYVDLTTGKLVNAKYVRDAKITVRYIDEDENFKVLDQDTIDGEIGEKINYDPTDKIMAYTNEGYALDSNNYSNQAGDTFTKNNNGKTFDILFKHQHVSVIPTNPGQIGMPDSPIQPSTLFTSLLAMTTETDIPGRWVVDTDDKEEPEIHWDYNTQSFAKVISPTEKHYYIQKITSDDNKDHRIGNDVNVISVKQNEIISPNNNLTINLTVTYAPMVKINVKFIDDTTGQDLSSYDKTFAEAKPGDSLNEYSTTKAITELQAKGYVLVSDAFTDAKLANKMPNKDNTYEVHLVHGTRPVNPQNPVDHNNPVDPKHPTNPVNKKDVPHLTQADLQKKATRTINYVDSNGKQLADPVASTVVFTGKGTIDTVTGNLVNLKSDGSIKDQNGQLTWTYAVDNGKAQNGTSYTFDKTANQPTIEFNGGIYRFNSVDQKDYDNGKGSVKAYPVNSTDPQNLTVNVKYDLVTYHPVKVDKTVIRTINYLDAQNRSKTVAPQVTQKSTLIRSKILDDQNNFIGYGTVSADGKTYTIDNSWKADKNWDEVTSPDLSSKGYEAPSIASVAEEGVDENTKDKVIDVYYDHDQLPINPSTKDKHGVDPSQLEKDVKETVHYVVSDGKVAAPVDKVQTSKWGRTVTVDAVTNEIVPNGQYDKDWAIEPGQKTSYDQVNTPVLNGYYADQANVPTTAVTQDDIEKTVTYKPVGHIIPVDKNGNPIPGQDHPQFPNDPNDPTKVNNGKKPTVPGYHPASGQPGDPVAPTPGNPGEDVKVPYVKDQGAVKVLFHDDTDNITIPNYGFDSGNEDAGTAVTYDPAQNISDLENQGYVYVRTDGTIPGTIPANDSVTVTIHMKHGVQPVNPNTPSTDVPKGTPKEAQPDQLTKKVNLNVTYQNSDGTSFKGTVPSNAKQTATFTGIAYVDKTNGKLVNAKQENGQWVIDDSNTATPEITWTADKTSFEGVTSPVETGYHVTSVSAHRDGDNVAAITGLFKDTRDINVVVIYAPNGTEFTKGQAEISRVSTPATITTMSTTPLTITHGEPISNGEKHSQKTNSRLPQTGNDQNDERIATISLLCTVLTGILSAAGLKKKTK